MIRIEDYVIDETKIEYAQLAMSQIHIKLKDCDLIVIELYEFTVAEQVFQNLCDYVLDIKASFTKEENDE